MGLLNQRGKNQSTMSSNAVELKPRMWTTSSMRLISKGKEINCFEGMDLNGSCLMRIHCLFLIESRALEGERRSTYWCMLAVLYSLFSILSFFFFLPFLSRCLLILLWFSPRGCYYNALWLFPLLCSARPLLIVPAVTGFYHFNL